MENLNKILKEHIKIMHCLYNKTNQLVSVFIEINLSDCKLTNVDLHYICNRLLLLYQMSNITLKATLNLSSNIFNDINPLEILLQENFIEILDLSNNDFDMKILMKLLKNNTSLRELNYI